MTAAAPAPPTHLLLAEDDAVSRAFLVQALEALPGCSVTAVALGQCALASARAIRFDALVLDLGLPDLDGAAVLSRLRGDEAAMSRTAPALALSAELDAQSSARLRAGGFAAAARKPLSVGRLHALLAGLMGAPVWNDAAAMSALAGRRDAIAGLRTLLRADLPAQLVQVRMALAMDRPGHARAVLHTLTAAAGFCGASELGDAVQGLATALADGSDPGQAVLAFESAAARVLAVPGELD
ncbi:MAG TPA: response regulator [Xanthomonadaceae bacterium]|nr:response regulator [Xanthomonadaceae bacterium]